MVEKMLANWESSGQSISFPEAQVGISSVEFLAMTLNEALNKLKSLLERFTKQDDPFVLPVFLDESSFSSNSADRKEIAYRFTFASSSFRCMLCTLVLMGTNASASNFLGSKSVINRGSGRSSDNIHPWCFVVYKLPNASDEYVELVMNSVIHKIKEKRQQEHGRLRLFPSEEVLKFIFKYLRLESPVFLKYTISFINSIISERIEIQSDYEFLNAFFVSLLASFRDRKTVHINSQALMNVGQQAYIMAYYRNAREPKSRFINPLCLKSDLMIHGHMAYLSGPCDDKKIHSIFHWLLFQKILARSIRCISVTI
jgi:hypothetical protein